VHEEVNRDKTGEADEMNLEVGSNKKLSCRREAVRCLVLLSIFVSR